MSDYDNKITCWLFVFALFITNTAMADTLYQQQVKQAEVSDKALQEALKQVKEHKDIELKDKLFAAPFHQRAEQQTTVKQAFCLTCHQPLPHRNNERSRTFMNKHSNYIACETCHLRPKDIQLEYRWLAYDGVDAGHELAARSAADEKSKVIEQSEIEKQSEQHRSKLNQPMPLAPQPEARIAPFYQGVPVLIFKQSNFADKTRAAWKDGRETERAKLKAQLHKPLEKKGPECQQCHGDEKPLLDIEALGALPQRAKQYQKNTIVRFFSRFKKDDQRIRIKDLLR